LWRTGAGRRPIRHPYPAVIFEVLSDSTRDYDRGSKFTAYRGIETLTDYVLVDQNAVHIEYFSKEGKGAWMLREYRDINDTVEILSVRIKLPVKEIYERTRVTMAEGTAAGIP
jgi:Uma2 family endonuclease